MGAAPDPPDLQAPPTDTLWVPGTRAFDPVNDALVPGLLVVMMWCFGSYVFSVRGVLFPIGQSILQFVFFCFLVGVVGIAKIRSIRGNDAISMPYIIGLAFAITVFVARFTRGVGGIAGSLTGALAFLSNLAIFAIVWAGVNWISRDCTVDPETEETASASMFDRVPEGRRRPGRSVAVFSLLAAAVFGLGQLVLARANRGAYLAGYLSASAYAASALLVLALTNLSGLRLYLTGRGLRAPSGMVGAWIGLSVLVIAVSLGAAWLIPRSGGYAGESVFARGDSHDAGGGGSRYGAASGIGHRADARTLHPDQRGGRTPGQGTGPGGDATTEGQAGRSGQGSSGTPTPGGSTDGQGPGDGTSGESQQDPSSTQDSREPRQGQRGEAQGALGLPMLDPHMQVIAWILLALLALIALFYLIRFLIRVLARLRGRATFQWPELHWPWHRGRLTARNPFADTRALDRLAPREQVLYCYGALMTLADRYGCPRAPSLTPLEFARDLPGPLSSLQTEVRDLSNLYVRAEYAPASDMAEYAPRVREIWDHLCAYEEAMRAAASKRRTPSRGGAP